MLQHRDLVLRRIFHFSERLRAALYSDAVPLTLTAYAVPGRITFAEAMKGKYTPISMGHKFAPNWSTHWVKGAFEIPAKLKNAELHLRWATRSEGCVWDANGVPLQAFAPDHRTAFPLLSAWVKARKGTALIEVAVNNLFGAENFADRMPWMGKGIGTLELAEIAVFHRDCWNLLMDFVVIAEMAQQLPEKSQRAADALCVANDIVTMVDFDDPKSIEKGRARAQSFLSEKGSPAAHQLSAIGHAHIDLAWLWPVAETQRKVYRTLSTALRNMEMYPEYKFVCSQMQIWSWLKSAHPAIFKQMVAKVKEGQLIPCGGSWVEPDCNLISLESFARQFLYGQRFMQKEFGFKSEVFWNPDVFGYSAQLPQILRQSGISYFLTQKMSWNQYNKFPHSSFVWQGLDGSRVLTHFPPADTYNCGATVKEVLYDVENDRSKECTRESYMLYGFGDGGSGPTEEMIERIRRMNDVEGLPKVKHRTPNEFFKRLEKDASKFHTWVGELYLELHRGCLTTQARNKRFNRMCENLLREVEFLYTQLPVKNYPREALQSVWENLLLNQFHDIIPGSSIHETYEVTAKEYAEDLRVLTQLKTQALKTLAGKPGDKLWVFNPHTWSESCVASLPCEMKHSQRLHDGSFVGKVSAPGLGYAVLAHPEKIEHPVKLKATKQGYVFENCSLRATFDKNAHLVSLFDVHADRETVAPGEFGNELVLYDDHSNVWDAWDIEAYYFEKRHTPPQVTAMEIVDAGPLRATLKVCYAVGEKSSLTQWISLDAEGVMLTFKNEADWHEKHRLLKVEFPWDVHADHAVYEITAGHLSRPNHENTSWDAARFEVCGHRWADLSETGYGVALLNDCKYGHHTLGNRMCLSLLRGSTYPDEEADMGAHEWTYAVYPHESGTADAMIPAKAALLNLPLSVRRTSKAIAEEAVLEIEGENIEITAVKRAEDSDARVIRFYETDGAHSMVVLRPTFPFKKAIRVNNLEEKIADLRVEDGEIVMEVKPFEIVSVKFD